MGAQGPTGTAPQREKHGQNEGRDPIHDLRREHPPLPETDIQASEGASFEDLHEQVGVLEQMALGELENALEAISGNRETIAETAEGKNGLPPFEKRLWRDLSGFPDLFLICIGPDRRAIYINDPMLKSLGWVAQEAAGVDIVRMLFPGPELEKAENVFSRLLQAGHPLSFETRVRTKDQGMLSIGWQMRLIRSPEEGQTYFLGIGMRKTPSEGLFHAGSILPDIGTPKRAIERKRPGHGHEDSAKKRLRKGFHSRWAYVVVYLLTSATICVLGALSGSKTVYYNGWLVFLKLTQGLRQEVLPNRDFMFGQGLFGDYALLVGGAIFFLLPGLFAVALVNAARAFGKD